MPKKSTVEKIKKKVICILDKYLGDKYLLFLFGSFAKANIDRVSDIDLAVYSKEKTPLSIILEAKEKLENEVPTLRGIDLVNLNDENIYKKLLENIIREGVLWKKPRNSEELLKNLRRHLRNLKK